MERANVPPVALVKDRLARVVSPVTSSVPVAVRFKVWIPPKAYKIFVVVAPFVVMVWRVAVEAAAPGQFVPFARQTD